MAADKFETVLHVNAEALERMLAERLAKDCWAWLDAHHKAPLVAACTGVVPGAAQEALREVLYASVEKAYLDGRAGPKPSPQERQEALEAIDAMIAQLDISTMSEADFQALARELGLDPKDLPRPAGPRVHDLRGAGRC